MAFQCHHLDLGAGALRDTVCVDSSQHHQSVLLWYFDDGVYQCHFGRQLEPCDRFFGPAGFGTCRLYECGGVCSRAVHHVFWTADDGKLSVGAFGVIIGVPALRLKGDYLAILTLGFGEIIRVLILATPFTGGAAGLSGIPLLTTFTYVFIVAILTVAVIFAFIHSRHGRAVIAIREDEIAAEAAGIHTTYYKLLAFVLAAFFAGIAGGLYAHHIGVLDPSKFDFNYSVEILIMVVLGGMGSITGSVVAAIVLTLLPELLRGFSEYRMLIYSIILICVMLFKPSGLLGQHEFSLTKILNKFRGKKAESKKEA